MGKKGRHAARVDRSVRIQRVIAVLKTASYPISAEEIAVRAYDFSVSRKIMLNVSTAIGEIRAEVNRDAGYFVSDAQAWNSPRYPWHDGRPRYWLIAAPGWLPAWKITEDGDLVPCGQRRDDEERPVAIEKEEKSQGADSRVCKNPSCGKPIPPDDPLSLCCNDECRRQWRASLFTQQNQDGPQGRLL